MSVVDLAELEEVKGLLLKGQQVGVLTFAEVASAVSEIDLDEADVEELHGYLERSEIELVEEVDPAIEAAQEDRAPDKRGRRKAKTTLDLKPDMTTDSLQLFLKDIGKVRLLTAQEEVDLARRIERGFLAAPAFFAGRLGHGFRGSFLRRVHVLDELDPRLLEVPVKVLDVGLVKIDLGDRRSDVAEGQNPELLPAVDEAFDLL